MFCKKRFLVLLFLIFFLVRVGAVGVGPPRYELNFEPNFEQVFSFTITSENPNTEFDLTLDGDLAQYATLSTNKITGYASRIEVNLKLPNSINKPGMHDVGVLITEVLPKDSKGIVVRTQLRPRIIVNVPYPGKYAEMEFGTADANAGEPVNFGLKIYSRGNEAITTNSRVEIYETGKLGEKLVNGTKFSPRLQALLSPSRTVSGRYVETVDLGSDSIPSGQFVEVNAKLDTTNYNSGLYKAVAVVEQSDQIIRDEKPFKLGELFVDISDYSNEFERDKIDSMIIELESYWNDKIENVYVTGEIEGTGITFQTPSISVLNPFEKQRVTGNFDTTGIKEDKFQAKLTVHYGDKTTEKIVDLHFVKKTDYVMIVLIGALVLAFAFFVFVVIDFLLLRKKKHESKK
jgi:hypothetical protein